jgi:RHS repeat-associated protein
VRNAGGAVYCYDKNGNMTSRNGSAISWYSYNQPNSISSGSNSTQFNYNANHQRWKQVAVDAGSTTTTYYVGGILEKVVRPTGVIEYRHSIPAGSGTAIYTRRSNSINSTYYVTTDHLGSGDLVLDSAGIVLARESFTPFGERRGSNWQGLPSAGDKSAFADVTRRGFTGHEMLDAVNLIHMNGRVYDPHLGRFLSADPIIPTISLSQALNPFSYVMNNPLTLIDPSGYSWLSKLFRSIGNFVKKYWRVIVAVVAAYFVGVWVYQALMNAASTAALAAANAAISATIDATIGATMYASAMAAASIEAAVVAGMAAGMVAGAITGGVQGAVVGAFTGLAFGLANSAWNAAGNGFAQSTGRALTAGAISGGSSEALGGKFKDGFWFAFAASAANSIYRSVVRYSATWASGGDAVQKTDSSPPVEGANNLFVQGRPLDQPGFWGEGGPMSRFANRIPGMNAIGGMHDQFVTHMGGAWRTVLNFPTMVPAVAITFSALVATTPAGYFIYAQSRAD